MVRDFGSLHDLVVSQDNVAFAKIVSACKVQHPIRARAGDLHPLQILSRANLFGRDAAD
jgi:hypothetical protein